MSRMASLLMIMTRDPLYSPYQMAVLVEDWWVHAWHIY